MSENFSFLFHYLKKENITIDEREFTFQVQSHSDYPSLLAVSDTLSFFNINNLATRIENEDLEHLPDNFTALISDENKNPFLAFVERNQSDFRYTQDAKSVQISKGAFSERFQNIVLLAEKEENELKINNSKKVLIFGSILLGIVYFSSIFITGFSLLQLLIVLFASMGVYLSIEAISHEFGIKTKFSEAVCTITTSADCGEVINSKKSKYFEWISFSDFSIAFFGSQLLALLFFTISNQLESFYAITTLLLLSAVPITILSIYQQWFVVKKWCPICMTIIVLIYAELISLLVFNSFHLIVNLLVVNYFALSLIASYLLTVYIKQIIKKNFELEDNVTEGNRFKRKYSLFKMALLDSRTIESKDNTSNSIVLGNPEARLKITVVSSPFCGHCKNAHEIIDEILKRYNDKVSITIQFNYNPKFSDEKSLIVHQKLIRLFLEKGQDAFVKALHIWFEEKNIDKLDSPDTSVCSDLKIDELLHEQFQWNQENKLTFTPAIIINGYLFPKQYDRNDLIYFINDLEDDDEF
ncbi:vitamin K epoxide reductase family protein [Flavobacterium sp. Fl-318]|uniref:Vitamin K epoxide reductase family protein n=1 Tax=Flavobacterium cupriresistens TaxID=2893885 RepID=A0ABU4R7P2_9FLAO|nr:MULTISPECIES: vitamin K epoxide reductase family protein [unclassified Flavobacterium]MDX6187828.1 vitamin K epoxide reductase family protein [Flavobacterium sp. Fl-318]UFH42250.1 thioredoxin domain-containing protein [Flavobacterium sp. F-323]